VMRCGDRTTAIAPGGLRLGEGDVCFDVLVERVLSVSGVVEGVGSHAGAQILFRIDPSQLTPAPGDVAVVSSEARSVVRFS